MLVFILTSPILKGQTATDKKIYSTYDQIVGIANTAIFNGPEFKDEFLNTDGSYRYLNGFDYKMGSIIYQDQFYPDIPLKYDLYGDNLIARSNDNLGAFNIRLIPQFISEFWLYDLHFRNLEMFGNKGFYEIAHKGDLVTLYIQHKKKILSKALRSGVQYSFKPINTYIIKHGGNFVQIKKSGDLRREFPQFKSEIKGFYRAHKTLQKRDRDGFMKKITAYLDTLKDTDANGEIP